MLKKGLQAVSMLGIAFFIYCFIQLGPENIWQKIEGISLIHFLILLGLRLIYWSLRSFNWKLILHSLGERPGFLKVFLARMASHSVSYLTPTAKIGGEVVRVFLLEESDKKVLTASVVIDKMAELMASLVLVVTGIIVAVLTIKFDFRIKVAVILLLIFLAGGTVYFFRKLKEGFFMWFRKKIRIGQKYLSKLKRDIEQTDRYIAQFYSGEKRIMITILTTYFLNYLLWVAEIYLTLSFLGVLNITLLKSFLLAALGSVAFLFPLLPGSLGIFEVTYLGLFQLLAVHPSSALGYIILRRILGLLLAGSGLLPLIRSGFGKERNS